MGYRNPEDMEPAQRGVERGAASGPGGPDDEVVIEHAHPRHVWAAYLPQEALEELAELVVEGWARPQAERYAGVDIVLIFPAHHRGMRANAS